jgi:hypothetical protein
MMPMDIAKQDLTPGALPVTQEAGTAHEQLPSSPRYVVYGKKFGNANELVDAVQAGLEASGRTDVDIYYSYNVANIANAFFGRYRDNPKAEQEDLAIASGSLALAESTTSPAVVPKGGSLVRRIKELVRPTDQVPDSPTPDTIPQGVLIFPEMRAYGESGMVGLTVDTPYKDIEDLCTQYGVPFAYVTKLIPDEITQGIKQLAAQAPELPPAPDPA